jgi:hypothetical protein
MGEPGSQMGENAHKFGLVESHRHPLGSRLPINPRLPTPAVSGNIALRTAHAIHNAPNSSARNKSNCRI